MEETRLGAVESRFADLIWQNAPLTSGGLAALCAEQLHWKKSTTYTVLKKLCARGIFQNNDGIVTPCLTRDEFYARRSEQIVEEDFNGSLPAFVAAFTKRKSLSEKELAELQHLIDAQRTKS